ncbi:MAG: polyphosphate kinase 1 [Bacteroidetes bacterium]|nr:polyphosphate kinase 1 [Bacteroidota bacterium]
MMARTKRFINREISWLYFNERVLQEAMDESNPIIERLKFLGIFSNNRDEYFRVRVATIKRMVQIEKKKEVKPVEPAEKVLAEILSTVEEQEKRFTSTFAEILKELKKHKIVFLNDTQLKKKQGEFVQKFFKNEVVPNLFPIMLKSLENPDTLSDNAIYLAVHLQDSMEQKDDDYALIMVPTNVISRFLLIPSKSKTNYVMMLDDVMRYCMKEIFAPFGFDTFRSYTIKFTRDAELDIDNDLAKSFIEQINDSVKRRKKGAPVRFVYDRNIPEVFLKRLLRKLNLTITDNLRGGGKYHNFKDFMSFPKIGTPELINPSFSTLSHPVLSKSISILKAIREQDILLHFPYQSFQYIVDLLREASIDPKVRAIKMTFYRAARDSNVINALINAAQNGKNVTVFLEIQARFDEEANIHWTRKLREEGVKIIKTLPGYKVHSKLLLIRRKEEGQNFYYANISTGNYNESTAKVYADDSLLTANQKIAREVNMLFHIFESPYNPPKFKHLIIAPYQLRNSFIKLLNTEIRNAKAGKDAWAIIKLNNLVDKKIINKIYQASNAGVKIDIICRGICVLIPHIKGLSENINVISIVDKFLEHSRILVFANGGNSKYYISSADWMIRNFDHRFETACPIYDEDLQNEIMDILKIQLSDNVKARVVNESPINKYVTKDKAKPLRSQIETYSYLKTISNS